MTVVGRTKEALIVCLVDQKFDSLGLKRREIGFRLTLDSRGWGQGRAEQEEGTVEEGEEKKRTRAAEGRGGGRGREGNEEMEKREKKRRMMRAAIEKIDQEEEEKP